MQMYNWPPPWEQNQQRVVFVPVPEQPKIDGKDSWEKAMKYFEKLERKKAKREDGDKDKKKKEGEKKPELSYGQAVFLTMVASPFIGAASFYAFATALKLSIEQLQAVIH